MAVDASITPRFGGAASPWRAKSVVAANLLHCVSIAQPNMILFNDIELAILVDFLVVAGEDVLDWRLIYYAVCAG